MADLVLVAPVWSSQPWYPKLLNFLVFTPLRIPPGKEVMVQVEEGLLSELAPPLAIWHILATLYREESFWRSYQVPFRV